MNNNIFFDKIKDGISATIINRDYILNNSYQFHVVEIEYLNPDNNTRYDIWYDWIYHKYYTYEV